MASERKSLGGLFLVCLPWRRRRGNSDPSPVSTHARNQNLEPSGLDPDPTTTTAIPLQEINPFPVVDKPKWDGLKLALKSLQARLDVYPPLQEVVGILLESMGNVQIADENRQEYEKLSTEIIVLLETLESHLPQTRPVTVPCSIENVVRALDELVQHIKRQGSRSAMSRNAAAGKDTDDLLRCYRRIGALFQQLQMDISLSIWDVVLEGQMYHQESSLQYLNPAYLAYYDAGLPMDMNQRGGCTRHTRIGVLGQANSWSQDVKAPKIYWMNGMAGTGKTTIAYSLCKQFEDNKQLAASFFCSRLSSECRDVNRIVPTIAYQLAQYSHSYRRVLCDVLNKAPDVARRRILVQFDKIIVEPLMKVKAAIPSDAVVAIDALDECDDAGGMKTILDLLIQHASDLPIKFFVTSRPEPSILKKILSCEDLSDSIVHLHDIEKSLVEEDIRKYLNEALAPIRPSAEIIWQLAAQAGCLFIFAATVVRYILPGDDSADNQDRLSDMLMVTPAVGHRDHKEIDNLYSAILSQAFKGDLRESEITMRQSVLWTIICAREPLDAPTIADILDTNNQKVELAIQPLRSIIYVSPKTQAISTFHASFPDFLLDAGRAGRFHCHRETNHARLATQCFALMTKSLRFNICHLETSHRLDCDITDLKDRVERSILPGLFYACRYWADHLCNVEATADILALLRGLLSNRLLFWVEVLNLKGSIEQGGNMLTQTLAWLPQNNMQTELRQLTYDARNFVTNFTASSASLSTPHLYVSMLPFTAQQSLIWSKYWPMTQGLLRVEGSAIGARGKAVIAAWSVGSGVWALARSADGQRVVSGSDDGTVSIWDVSRGSRLVGPLHGHSDKVWSVAFSFDGMRVASGSRDCTIRLWDAFNGTPVADTLQGHTKSVTGLAFSPDGSRLASGSEDHTICIWDVHSGTKSGVPLEGHQAWVTSVVFSPDGKRIASGSDDRTVRVWSTDTYMTVAGPFTGHTEWVDCVVFSPDGLRIASCSVDQTIRVWDSHSGSMLVGPLEGHTGRVRTVAFSPDGRRVASGSDDLTVRAWDLEGGRLSAGPFEGHQAFISAVLFSVDGARVISSSGDGSICVWDVQYGTAAASKSFGHTNSIFSVAFSPDGARAVSGSADRTVCIWDTREGTLLSPPLTGHTRPIESVAFSPDGAQVVSGSRDHTIRTWDAYTGALLAGPFEGHTDQVRSVAFSPDGNRIVSGSHDHTLRLWDSHTGASVGEPLTGHTHWVNSVAFSTDGTRVVSGSRDCTICMWDAHGSALPLWRSGDHHHAVGCVAFSPDGTRVAFGSDDCTILVLNALDGTMLHGPFTGHTDVIWSIGFSPEGSRIVSGSKDCTVCIWDVQSGKLVTDPLKAHTKEVGSVAFSPDGARIISGSTDYTIRFWDVAGIENTQGVSLRFDRPPNDEGWLTDSESQLLLWLPSDLRQHLPLPRNSMVISPRGAIQADYSDLLLGERWHECYVDSSDSS